jgi:hypothetical protein
MFDHETVSVAKIVVEGHEKPKLVNRDIVEHQADPQHEFNFGQKDHCKTEM